eukprot:317551-Chlamydomonas_euryale.AAC.3
MPLTAPLLTHPHHLHDLDLGIGLALANMRAAGDDVAHQLAGTGSDEATWVCSNANSSADSNANSSAHVEAHQNAADKP